MRKSAAAEQLRIANMTKQKERQRRRQAEEALEAKIDSVIREAAAPLLDSLNVHVSSQFIRIEARACRFWHRRKLRQTIESLSARSEFQTEITVT
jgi:hypothetical protein